MKTVIIICIILILLVIIIYFLKQEKLEHAFFLLDGLYLPINPQNINEAEVRKFIRTIGLKRNLKIDSIGRIETITYSTPVPELGETSCHIIPCPAIVNDDICWKCQ